MCLNVDDATTVKGLRQKLEERIPIPATYSLTFAGKVLNCDENNLRAYGIQSESTVHTWCKGTLPKKKANYLQIIHEHT